MLRSVFFLTASHCMDPTLRLSWPKEHGVIIRQAIRSFPPRTAAKVVLEHIMARGLIPPTELPPLYKVLEKINNERAKAETERMMENARADAKSKAEETDSYDSASESSAPTDASSLLSALSSKSKSKSKTSSPTSVANPEADKFLARASMPLNSPSSSGALAYINQQERQLMAQKTKSYESYASAAAAILSNSASSSAPPSAVTIASVAPVSSAVPPLTPAPAMSSFYDEDDPDCLSDFQHLAPEKKRPRAPSRSNFPARADKFSDIAHLVSPEDSSLFHLHICGMHITRSQVCYMLRVPHYCTVTTKVDEGKVMVSLLLTVLDSTLTSHLNGQRAGESGIAGYKFLPTVKHGKPRSVSFPLPLPYDADLSHVDKPVTDFFPSNHEKLCTITVYRHAED